jgi:hypothetical protein
MYTDPGSGLFLVQIVIAVALTMLYRCRRKISSIFGARQDRDIEE